MEGSVGDRSPLETARRATGLSLAIFVGGNVGLATVGVAILARLPTIGELVWPAAPGPLAIATVVRLIVGGVLILWLGKLRFEDIGLVWNRVGPGIVLSLLIWGLAQPIDLALALARGGGVEIQPSWRDLAAASPVLGRLMSQTFAAALVEEVSLRGYLLPQIYLFLADRWAGRPRLRRYLALAISQALFAGLHVPFLLWAGVPGANLAFILPIIFVFGLLFSAVYLWTGNLFLAMGSHALLTATTPVFAGGVPVLSMLAGTVLVLVGIELRKRASA